MKIKELTAKDIKNIMIDKALIIVPVFIIIGIIIIEPSLLQIRILTDILTQSAVKMICTLGLMFALLLGGIDLFGGRQVGLAAVMVASLPQMADYSNRFWPGSPELPIIVPVIMTLALIAVIGTVNGLMITRLKMVPPIATFGISTIVYGISCLYFAKKPSNSQPIGGIRNDLTMLSSFKIFGQISSLVVITTIAVVGVWFLLSKTVFGKNIYIVGGNPEAARVSGVNVSEAIVTVFIIESMFIGLAGILEVARIGDANLAYGNAYELGAISSCAVGGASLSGGVGEVSDVIIGVLIFIFISYGLVYIRVNSNWQLIVKGFIIYSTVALDMRKDS